MTARLTVITSRRPATLSKTVQRGPDGSIIRHSGGLLVEGDAEIATVSSLGEFAALLQRLGPAQALTFGLPRGGAGRILSRAALAKRGCAPGILTRTRDQFAWPDGPGILMLDHDPDEVALSREELVQLIRTAAPGLADVAMLWWPSASSHICDAKTGQDLTGLRGQRIYLFVCEARDIPRAGAALVDRFWAAGHGRILVGAAGAALERCPVDGSVWQPERLDFAAGAVCGNGLVQRRGDPLLILGSNEPIDTRMALPDDAAISKTASAARRRAKADAADAMEAAREGFLDAQGSGLLAPEDREDPEKRAAARTVIRRALDTNVLTADFCVDRVLGRSESQSIPNRALLLLTGNNLCPAGDLPRRIITIRIDPGTDAPFARQFDLDPLEYVLDHRMELASAALVLIRGWLSSGAARAEGRIASFESWDDLVRQTVCWIGTEIAPGQFGDPLDLVRRAQGSDPEQESLFALLEALD